jgi:hypothetical protein
MQNELNELEQLSEAHADVGRSLLEACNASLFPADVVALSVLDRSMSLIRGFVLLVKNGGYIPAAGILRMQLDNVLRFDGVSSSPDPHDVANKMLNGVPLRKIADDAGKKMTDARLKERISEANPWIEHVYKLSSGYIHLSEQHVMHLLQRSARNAQGSRDIAIGDEDTYLRDDQRLDLINTFAVVTRGVLKLVRSWTEHRRAHGTEEQLRARFRHAA